MKSRDKWVNLWYNPYKCFIRSMSVNSARILYIIVPYCQTVKKQPESLYKLLKYIFLDNYLDHTTPLNLETDPVLVSGFRSTVGQI